MRSRAFSVADKRTSSGVDGTSSGVDGTSSGVDGTSSPSPRDPDPKEVGSASGQGAGSGGAGRAKETGDGGFFKPSAAAIEEAKAAARKSGGLYVCVRLCIVCAFGYVGVRLCMWCGVGLLVMGKRPGHGC